MHYSRKSFSVITSSLLALGLTTQAFAQNAAPAAGSGAGVIGIVDKEKVVTGYPRAQDAANELKSAEEKVHKLIESSNKQYEEAKNAKKPQAELEALQKRLQGSIDSEVKRIQARAQELEKQLETDIDKAIKDEAASRKVSAVFMKQAVLVGGTDLTDGVAKRLASSGTAPKTK